MHWSEPINLGTVRNLEDLDFKALQVQNRKLFQRLEERRRMEDSLQKRIEQLEQRQTRDDALFCIVDRHWNALDEDLRLLLQRFDVPAAPAVAAAEEAELEAADAPESFTQQLASLEREEVDAKLRQRVEFSCRAVSKLLGAYDGLLRRLERLRAVVVQRDASADPLGDEAAAREAAEVPAVLAAEVTSLQREGAALQSQATQLHARHRVQDLELRRLGASLEAAQDAADEWRAKHEDAEYKLERADAKLCRVERAAQDLLSERRELLERLAATAGDTGGDGDGDSERPLEGGVARSRFKELAEELDGAREQASGRLAELEQLQDKHQAAVREAERLRAELRELPEGLVQATAEYQALRGQFNILYNEASLMRAQLEEARGHLETLHAAHLRQIEQMEGNELACQKQMHAEMLAMEETAGHLKRDFETVKQELELTLAQQEQAAPINNEMRSLIGTLQLHNKQLKAEVLQYRKRCKELQLELGRTAAQNKAADEELHKTRAALLLAQRRPAPPPHHPGPTLPTVAVVKSEPGTVKKEEDVKKEAGGAEKATSEPPSAVGADSDAVATDDKAAVTDTAPSAAAASSDGGKNAAAAPTGKTDSGPAVTTAPSTATSAASAGKGAAVATLPPSGKAGAGTLTVSTASVVPGSSSAPSTPVLHGPAGREVEELRSQLRRAHEGSRELRTALDGYKNLATEQRTRAQLMAVEQRLRQDVDEARQEIARLRGQSAAQTAQEQQRRLRRAEEAAAHLQQKLASAKQEEDALQKEMEIMGQAFEDIQERCVRQLEQLKEKDDANFKLVSERMKDSKVQRSLKEEKEVISEQLKIVVAQLEAQNHVVRKLEEKERLLLGNLQTLEKELAGRQQALELHRRDGLKSQQLAAELKLNVDKYLSQLREAQLTVQDKAVALEKDSFKHRRVMEELASTRRKFERLKKMEAAHNVDEVLLAEIADYKEQLTCPCCKVRRKDAILSKCFHVFCLDCLKTRYETRNRKCPKCNATFGANDYHRIYLA